MSDLFQLPKQVAISAGAVVPGARLYFTRTTTTTPQTVYQDNARSTAHADPVEADGAGVFPAIYLDPTLPDYRVRLTDANDVLIYQVDGVPSNQNTQQSIRLESTNPELFFYDTDGNSGTRKFRIAAAGDRLVFQHVNDAETVNTSLLQIVRSLHPYIILNATTVIDTGAGEEEVAYRTGGTFTGTLTGCTTSPTGVVVYNRFSESVVVLDIPAISATSNTTAMTITGMPAAIWPLADRYLSFPALTDNSATTSNVNVSITTAGVITFRLGNSPTGFTNSGTKGTANGATIVYSL